MKGHRYKQRGWFGESHRHYLASKGIKTKLPLHKQFFATKATGKQKTVVNTNGKPLFSPENVGPKTYKDVGKHMKLYHKYHDNRGEEPFVETTHIKKLSLSDYLSMYDLLEREGMIEEKRLFLYEEKAQVERTRKKNQVRNLRKHLRHHSNQKNSSFHHPNKKVSGQKAFIH